MTGAGVTDRLLRDVIIAEATNCKKILDIVFNISGRAFFFVIPLKQDFTVIAMINFCLLVFTLFVFLLT